MRILFYLVIALIVFAGIAVSRIPMAVVTDRVPPPLAFEDVRGTIWNGAASRVRFGAIDLGAAELSLKALPLLQRKAKADLSIDGEAGQFSGLLSFDGNRLEAEGARAAAELARFNMRDGFGNRLAGTLDVAIDRLAFSRSAGCETADLSVSTDAVSRSLGAEGGETFLLKGEGYCDGETLVVPLAGRGPEAELEAELRLQKNGGWKTELIIAPTSPEMGRYLEAMGFAPQGRAQGDSQRYVVTTTGRGFGR